MQSMQGIAVAGMENIVGAKTKKRNKTDNGGKDAAPSTIGEDIAAVDAFLKENQDFEKVDQGKIRCLVTGHEMPPRLNVLKEHKTGRKYANAARKKASGPLDMSEFPNMVDHKSNPNMVYCKLTKTILNKDLKELRAHVQGRKYKFKLSHRKPRKDNEVWNWEDEEEDEEAEETDEGQSDKDQDAESKEVEAQEQEFHSEKLQIIYFKKQKEGQKESEQQKLQPQNTEMDEFSAGGLQEGDKAEHQEHAAKKRPRAQMVPQGKRKGFVDFLQSLKEAGNKQKSRPRESTGQTGANQNGEESQTGSNRVRKQMPVNLHAKSFEAAKGSRKKKKSKAVQNP
eukprot:g76927.t1